MAVVKYIRRRIARLRRSTLGVLWADIIDKPTIPSAQVQSDWNQSNNSSIEYIKNKPSIKRTEVLSGTTNASGIVSFTFSAFTNPRAVAEIINPSINQDCRVTALTSTGCTVHAWQRNSVNLLGIDVLLSAVVNLSGAVIHVKITEA